MQYYFIVYKPYLVLSQFTSVDGKKSLADFFAVPKDVYPVGRLDHDSEGLLLLTNDTKINQLLLHPKHKHEREYWVQVDGSITQHAADRLEKGVIININGKPYATGASRVNIFSAPPVVAERDPPIRFRKFIPSSWLSITLTEGKNRQIRKMTAESGFPTLRLIRYRIEQLTLSNMFPGHMRQLNRYQVYSSLFI